MPDLDVFVYASDWDQALEIAGNGADVEFESVEHALRELDPEVHAGRNIYRIRVDEVWKFKPKE